MKSYVSGGERTRDSESTLSESDLLKTNQSYNYLIIYLAPLLFCLGLGDFFSLFWVPAVWNWIKLKDLASKQIELAKAGWKRDEGSRRVTHLCGLVVDWAIDLFMTTSHSDVVYKLLVMSWCKLI